VDLVVDLRFDAVPDQTGTGPVLDLHTLAASLRSPWTLRQLVRARHHERVLIETDDLPMSAFQAIVQLALVIARADAWVVGGQPLRRAGFAAHAIGAAAIAIPRELWLSAVATFRLLRSARRSVDLPARPQATARALYLRAEPSLRWLGSQVGGAATHTRGVVNGLLVNGVDVQVVAIEQPIGTERARFTAVPPRRVLQLVRGLGYTDYARTIVRACADMSADFVYQRYQFGSDAGLEVAHRLGVPLVLEFNGPEMWVQRHWRSGRMLLERPLEQLERRHLHEASLVVVVSDPLRDHVVARGVPAERILVNPNGVDVDELAQYREGSSADWRRRLELPAEPTVGFIGTFGPWHGVALLPSMIAAVPEAHWVLIGGGGLFSAVQSELRTRGLANRVTLTGVLEHRRALEMLACCDVCVSPHIPNPDGTPFFGSPTKLFEYMGLRRAIVASDLDQIGEVIEHERSGLLCRPGAVDDAAAAIKRLLNDEQLRDRLAGGALERAAREYSWTAHVGRILSALAGEYHANTRRDVASVTAP
jgi:glycosyltransferase involved in cell wall biosynthesis